MANAKYTPIPTQQTREKDKDEEVPKQCPVELHVIQRRRKVPSESGFYSDLIARFGRSFERLVEKANAHQALELAKKGVFIDSLTPKFLLPQSAFEYSELRAKAKKEVVRLPELEELMKKDGFYAYKYAKDVLKDRWIEAEDAIAEGSYCFEYARDVVKGRWLRGEKKILKNSREAMKYVMEIVKERIPEAEEEIGSEAERAYEYALEIIEGPFPMGEKALAADPKYGYLYAKNVLKNRFPEAEQNISNDITHCFLYTEFLMELAENYGSETERDPTERDS